MKTKLNLSDKFLILLYTLPALVLLISECSCTTPAITTYQQGTCIGDRAEIRETLNLNERVSYYPCKCDSGEKVIITRKLK